MRKSNFIKIILFTVAVLFFNITFSQYSKSHYIPPITTTGNGAASPLDQYIYISTPSETPVNVTIRPLGSEEITGLVSNSNPWAYFIGTGNETNLIVNTNSLNGSVFNNKGFIVESENLIYVSVRLFSGGYYQAGTIVSKGTAALGTEFRAGSFENQGFLQGGTPSNYLNFISVLASRDNTTVNFSSFGNGVNILNNQPIENILLNAGESYSVAISPYPSPVNEANAQGLIGALVTSDKPIAVNTGSFTGSNSNYNEGGGQDMGIDQIAPSTIIGNEYIFVRGLGPDEVERPLIVAHEDNTAVSVNGNLETILNAGDFYSIPSTFYGVSYSNTVYEGFGNVNDDGYPETVDGVPINPFNNADDQPPTNQSSNMYVSTSKPVFAYQVIGGIRPGSESAFGITNGVANVGLFFVPPLNCKTPSSVNNIPDVSQIGNEIFGGVMTIVSEAGAEITINGSPISNYAAFPEPVQSNPLYESYTIEGLIGDVSIESTAQVYVATFGAYDYATFGGYYSGFEFKPEIILDNLDNEGLNCIPNLTLSLSSISTYDDYQWFYNGDPIDGANSADYTPSNPGYYQISGLIENCEGSLLSNNIPVSDCPKDSDNDGINDNVDIDNDNDGITDCDESLGDQNLTLNLSGGNLDNIGNYSINLSHIPSSPEESGWVANDEGFTTNVPLAYINENVEKSPGQTISQVTFDSEVSLEFYFDISDGGISMNDEQWYSIVVPFDKTITLLDPNDELRIDSNFDGIFESGITEISNFNIRFKANDENLTTGSFSFKTHLTNYFEFQNYNNSLNDLGGVSFKVKATCVPKDSDLDGIVDARDYDSDNDGIPDLIESQGNNFSPLSGIDVNNDGYDDIFNENFIAFDFDNDSIPDYLDLDSDNDGIYDLHESGALDFVTDNDLDGLIDEISVGNNGLSNSLEEIIDNSSIVYAVHDFDDDLFYNYIDLDSEDDGCYDVIEAGFTETDDDGILGTGETIIDSTTGKVISDSGYNFADENYEIGAPIIIDSQPEENIITCENDSFSISFETSTFDILQWQISYPTSVGSPSWNDITNNLFFSGVNEKILFVTEPQLDLNNVSFRALIQRNGNSCDLYTSETLVTVNPNPTVIIGPTYEVCDDDYDGIGSYDLSTLDETLLDGQTGVSISYYESQEDADNATNVLDVNYQNTIPDNQTLYVRLEVDETGCYATTTQELIVNPLPEIITPTPLEECDDDYDGIVSFFDLSQKTEEILNGQTGISVSYYETLENAESGENPIEGLYTNIEVDTQTLYVRLEVDETGCYATTTQELIVNPIPTVLVGPTYEVCDDDYDGIGSYDLSTLDETLLDGQTGVSISYYESQEDADNATNVLDVNYQNTIPDNQTLYVRLEVDETGCYATTTQELIVNPIPTVLVGPTYEVCDDDYDGIGSYDLSTLDETLLDGQTGVSISYYESQEDADNATNVLDVNYQNTIPDNQTLYVRLEVDETGCYATTTQELIVNPIPTVLVGPTYEVCDDDYDGIGSYDLSTLDETLLDGQTGVSISYYESQEDADNATNVLDVNYQNTIPDNQTLYVRLEVDETGCYATTTQELIVNPLPEIITPTPLEECDDDYDGIVSFFDLSQKTEEILNGQTGISVSYYETLENAESGENPIEGLYTNIEVDTQTLYVRLEVDETGCYATTTQELIVNPIPTVLVGPTYEVCDDDYDGIGSYDLSTLDETLLDGQTGVSISYYESQEDADNATNVLDVNYQNTIPDNQTLYVRLEVDETGCYATTTQELIVNPIPTVLVGPTYEVCDDDYDGIGSYDLSTLDETLLDGQTGVSISYYESQEDADNATNVLDVNYQNTIPDNQTLYVRLEVDETGCYATTTQELIVHPLAVIEVSNYELCDYTNPGDLIEVFDITTKSDEIINEQDVVLTYFTSLLDSQNNTNPISNEELVAYSNTEPTETIYVTLEQNTTGCVTYGSFDIIVNPLPNVIENTDLVQCDIDDVQDGISIYNLEEAAENIVIGDDPNNYVLTFHLSQEDLDAGINAIEEPTAYVNETPLQNIYCRVENINTGCYTTSYFYLETVFNPIPDDAGLVVCDDSEMNGTDADYNGLGLFTLSDADEYVLSLIVANPNNDITDASQLNVSYYFDENDALLELNQLPNEYISEVPDQQTIYLRVERGNDCFGINSMLLEVLPVPEIITPTPLEECDDDYDGIVSFFDLSQKTEEILNGQTGISVSYYETLENAESGENPIEGLYTNIEVDTQTLYVRLVDDLNNCVSSTSLDLIVNPLPEIITPTPLEECDDDYDGIVSFFDLSQKTEEILNGQTGISVSYYETLENAESGENPIEGLYTNIEVDTQTLYVRLEVDETGCYATTTQELIVNPIPTVLVGPTYEVCDDDYDGIGSYDLSTLDETLLDGQTGVSISYYESQEDADNATNVLDVNYQNTIPDNQTLYVRLEVDETGCYATTTQELIVNPLPEIITPTPLEECDDDYDGIVSFFDLSQKTEEILNGQTGISVSYYETLENAESGENPIEGLYTNIEVDTQTLYVRLEVDETGCYATTTQELIVNPIPTVLVGPTYEVCDDDYDGIGSYDLSTLDETLLDGQTGVSISYYESQEDADNATNVLDVNYQNTIPDNQTLYVRLEVDETGCYATTTQELIVNPLPEIITPTPLEECDDDYDGIVSFFDLSQKTEEILNGQTGISVSYYETLENAESGENPIEGLYTNIEVDTQTLYVRLEVDETGCYATTTQELIVNPIPTYTNIIDQILCTDTPGFFDIILSDYDVQVLNGQNPDQYTITYHTSADDAENGVNALENAYTVVDYIDLFVRIEDNITACYISNIDFTLTVEPKPLFTPPDQPIILCDEDTDGFTTIDISIMTEDIMRGPDGAIIEENIVTYHETAEDMNLGTNPIENPAAYVNIANPQIVYVRIEDNMTPSTGCYADTTLELIVQTPPAVNEPSSLEYCDPDADGFGVFDLTTANAEIANGSENLAISYHETEADAENNVNAIVGEYNNIVAYEQTVYIRVEDDASDNDCASQLTLTLIVNDVPQINTEPSSLSLCDENSDGFGIFDLSTSSEELLNGLDPSDFTITYYEAQDDAQNALNAIVTPYNYTNTTAFNQFIWARIENNTTACYNVGSIELIINELPILTQPSPLNLCDDNNSGDEVEGFTLEDSIGEVLQGQTGINISFHESQEDADNAVNPIVSPYNNTTNAQTIYIRGEDEITGCYATITLDLRVNPIPSPVTPEPIEECDDDNDGFTFFTLETNEEEIINGELDIVLSYYSTLTNAQNDVNPIISPYYNIVPDNQIIFVRAENELTGCFTIVEQELITIPSPEIPLIIEDIVACDDDYDDIALFDLTQREEDILGEQSSSEVILTYHESLLDAETGDNPIVNTTSYQNLSNPQTIYVRLEDTVNGCINTGTFNLIVTLPPVIVQADPLQECDDEIADQITEFDLTIKDSEITAGNIDWEVIYYETQQDAFDAINPIENPEAYSNTSVQGNPANPQTLYVAVVNEFGCIAYNYLTIEVLPNPTPNLDPSNIEQCDNNNAGDLTETFDITVHEDYILNGESGVGIAYHESLDDALSGINPITDPSNYANVVPGVQTIYVAVTKDITGCVTVVTFDIIVNPLPDISSVADIVICEVNTDNVYDFDLDEITVQLLGSQDVSNFTVTYHETQQDAEDSLNILTSPYTNTSSPQQLFVNISNNTTGCFVTGAGFTLDVQEAAVANTDAQPAVLEECDIDNDGFAQFILTDLNQDILDGLDANDFTVGYYENLQDAEDSSNALPNNYTNISSPQIIYVRLDNDTYPSSQCYDITTATLIVNELPFFSLEASYMGCENANGSEVVDSLMETNLPESEYDFEWYDPTGTLVATTSSHFPTMAGTYTATVTNELTGCQYSTTTEVYTSATAVVSATVTTLAFAQEHVIQATATGIGDYEFRLDTGPWQLDGTFNNVSPGLHTVYVRDLNGCGMGTATVLVVDYPRFFTPNGDGYNDTWHIIGADLHPGLVASDIYIFDRYGKLLKKLDPQGDGWDGTYNGRPMPSTDYWFTIEYQIPALNVTRRFRAHFSLKR